MFNLRMATNGNLRRVKLDLVNRAKRQEHTLGRFVNFGDMAKTSCLTCGESVDTRDAIQKIDKRCPFPGVSQFIVICDAKPLIAVQIPIGNRDMRSINAKVLAEVRRLGGTLVSSYELAPYKLPRSFVIIQL